MPAVAAESENPQDIPIVEIGDFGRLMTEISATVDVPRVAFWRGQLEGWSLVPTVFRDPTLQNREVRMAMDFRQTAPARMGEYPRDNERAKWLALMRHSGLPTRLLDWSGSPLVALFFAVERRKNSEEDKAPAVIWRLSSLRLNRAQAQFSGLFGIQHPKVEEIAGRAWGVRRKKEGEEKSGDTPGVVAMAPYHFSPQHMAQQSCFTMHVNEKPLNERRGAGQFLKKFVIPAEAKEDMRGRLAALGIERRYLFPDLPNLAAALRERHGGRAGN